MTYYFDAGDAMFVCLFVFLYSHIKYGTFKQK